MPETEAESINVLRALVERYHPHGPASEGLRTIYTRACHVHQHPTARPHGGLEGVQEGKTLHNPSRRPTWLSN